MFEIIITNPYTGHWGVIERVWGVPFLHFCSTSKEECETFLHGYLAEKSK